MKHLLLLAPLLAAAVSGAADVSLGRLPECGYADTETSTNVPFAFVRSGVRNFQFDMSLVGTPSNNVQLAFGRDADGDGVLSVDEADMAFGWDCGEWRIVNFPAGEVLASAPATTNLAKNAKWDLRIRRGRPNRLALTENGRAIFPGCAESPEPWFYTLGWNMLRLTVRGVDAAQESALVRLNIVGYTINLR